MPSAMVGNNAVQSSSPDLGSGTQSEAMKQVLQVIDKKVRNMEKKKGKLDDYQAKKNKGERLNQDQLEALTKFQEVSNNLDFARELQKSFLSLGQEIQKAVRKSARREQLQREEMEQRRLKTVLELQFLLDRLGDEQTRQDLKQLSAGCPLLTDSELNALDSFYKLVGPERDHDVRLIDQYEEASQHLWELLEGSDKAVAGTTYKALKETLDKVLLSGYFDRAQKHQNGVCEEEEEEEEEQQLSSGVFGKFVNRQFIPETTYSSTDNNLLEDWTAETQVVNAFQHHPPPHLAPETHTVNPIAPSLTPDPVVRKQVVQDLMAQMQGTYNFMQVRACLTDPYSLICPVLGAVLYLAWPLFTLTPVLPPTGLHVGVFNLNAPVPPTNEAESLKQNQLPSNYSQGFSSQAEHSVEQKEIQQETPQSGGFLNQDQGMPSAGGHQVHSSQGPSFGRPVQSFYNSRGAMPRGGPRNPRGMINGYRGSSNGFRGGYDGYRPPFSNTPNSGYGQPTQFSTPPRDYSNTTYQREGYQPGYKRGVAQGPRGCSRGNAEAMRS
uniref:Cell cycle associated protein 1a n=1 Tax=Esox lucius TaxID=8010 RepID=A0A6Q2Y197_ESOLU